ncbi:MAG TPA: DUF2946 family protein [Ramlibacter sp.]|uniref:DUF2946 family protein n=1 Tax=Ramlibacter sp. TaxID=1917967 RepID=UPI002ED3EFE2
MRRWLLLFLVLLLPLRGLVGEAMAGQMLAQSAQEAQAPQQGHAAAHDCDQHGAAHADEAVAAAQDEAAGAHGDCPTCAACQVCSSFAVIPSAVAPASTRLSQAPPPAVTVAFHSAEPAHAFKPPRS